MESIVGLHAEPNTRVKSQHLFKLQRSHRLNWGLTRDNFAYQLGRSPTAPCKFGMGNLPVFKPFLQYPSRWDGVIGFISVCNSCHQSTLVSNVSKPPSLLCGQMILADPTRISMVIHHFHDLDCRYPVGIYSSIFPLWDGIVGRFKYQPVRMNQIYCILTPSITYKLVPSIRSGCRHHCQCSGILQNRKAHFDSARHTITVSSTEFPI